MNKDIAEKTVYVAMCADILHSGHVNIISEARKLGKVIIGLVTDEAISSYKGISHLDYQKRFDVVSSIKDVEQVVPQHSLDYTENLMAIKPDYVLHGDDWKIGIQESTREKVISLIAKWGGKVVDIPYTKGISSTTIRKSIEHINRIPYFRSKQLKQRLQVGGNLRILEAHNAISAHIVENTHIYETNGCRKEFDGVWFSSLTDSAARGKADVEIVDLTSKILTLKEMINITNKPIIVDADTGGSIMNLRETIIAYESIGVSAICIEDKTGNKLNSLYGTSVKQTQIDIEEFCEKIRVAKETHINDDFIIIARVESLVLAKGIDDAIIRAEAYVDAGADMIFMHSVSRNSQEIIEFSSRFSHRAPLVVVPTTYNSCYEQDLFAAGIKVVIYANHLLRAAYAAMQQAAKNILVSQRALEVESFCIPVKQLLDLTMEV